jgi:glucose-6-phosphate isomerase
VAPSGAVRASSTLDLGTDHLAGLAARLVAKGVFLQVTGAVERDVPVPGQPFSFGRREMAQALGDQGALTERGRPVVRLHLRRRAQGAAQLLSATEALTTGGVR